MNEHSGDPARTWPQLLLAVPRIPAAELPARLAAAPWKHTDHVKPHEYIMSHWGSECAALVVTVREMLLVNGKIEPYNDTTWRTLDTYGDGYYYFGGLPAVRDRQYAGKGPFVLNRRKLLKMSAPKLAPGYQP